MHGSHIQHAKKKISVPGGILATVLGILQVTFAFLAFWDLANRDQREVAGPKLAWIPAILVNWIGPSVYFLFGIKR